MQAMRRTNQQRTKETRGAILAAARDLFVQKGYSATSTPEIVAVAGITRGALYHHFEDKRDLFRAVLVAESTAVEAAIYVSATAGSSASEALINGANAYLAAMQVVGRTRLLLIEGPAVLGQEEMISLDNRHAARTLREGLAALFWPDDVNNEQLDAVADLLSAAFDRAALAMNGRSDTKSFRDAIALLIDCVAFRSQMLETAAQMKSGDRG